MATTLKTNGTGTTNQRCPKCGGTQWQEPYIAYFGRTIERAGIKYEHGGVIAKCAMCGLPVPQQINTHE